jgi:hypothetical protein
MIAEATLALSQKWPATRFQNVSRRKSMKFAGYTTHKDGHARSTLELVSNADVRCSVSASDFAILRSHGQSVVEFRELIPSECLRS